MHCVSKDLHILLVDEQQQLQADPNIMHCRYPGLLSAHQGKVSVTNLMVMAVTEEELILPTLLKDA